MIILFIITLFLTLFIIRTCAICLHDKYAYKNRKWKGAKYDNSKTITGFLRRRLGFDVHHFHLGLIILIFIIPITLLTRLTQLNVIILGIGLSMFMDQISGVVSDVEYFSKKSLFLSFILHVISIGLFYLLIKI